jgi:hypothetical protein
MFHDGVSHVAGRGGSQPAATEDAEDTEECFYEHRFLALFYHPRLLAARRNLSLRYSRCTGLRACPQKEGAM